MASNIANYSDHKMNKHSTDVRTDEMSQLIVKVANDRDRRAYELLFDHFAPLIKRFYLAKSGGSDVMVEELVQEAMLKVWLKAESFDASKSSAATWVFTVARNSRIDMYRRKSRQDRILEVEDIWDDVQEDTAMTSLEATRAEQHIKAHMKNLPQEQALVLQKIYMEGLSHSEAAKALNVPLGTVKSRVRLAFKKLQSVISR